MFAIGEIFKKFPTKVIIFEMRGTSSRLIYDKASRQKRADGTHIMQLQKMRGPDGKPEVFPAPTNDFYTMTERGKSVLILVSPKSGVYVPAKANKYTLEIKNDLGETERIAFDPEHIGIALHLADSRIDEWRALESQRVFELTRPEVPWWQANFPLIGVMIVCGILAFVMIFAFGPIQNLSGSLVTTSDNILKTVQLQGQYLAGSLTEAPRIG